MRTKLQKFFKPIDYVFKQLQSKRFHVKRQENKKRYDRNRAKELAHREEGE